MNQVIFDPHPRTPALIFDFEVFREFSDRYHVNEPEHVNDLAFYQQHIENARYIVGQPPLDKKLLDKAVNLKAIFRSLPGNLLSAHRAGALDSAFKQITYSP